MEKNYTVDTFSALIFKLKEKEEITSNEAEKIIFDYSNNKKNYLEFLSSEKKTIINNALEENNKSKIKDNKR